MLGLRWRRGDAAHLALQHVLGMISRFARLSFARGSRLGPLHQAGTSRCGRWAAPAHCELPGDLWRRRTRDPCRQRRERHEPARRGRVRQALECNTHRRARIVMPREEGTDFADVYQRGRAVAITVGRTMSLILGVKVSIPIRVSGLKPWRPTPMTRNSRASIKRPTAPARAVHMTGNWFKSTNQAAGQFFGRHQRRSYGRKN